MTDPKFIDAESYQGTKDDGLTFKEIVLQHLRRIGGLASKEFRGGYWQDRTKMVGGVGIKERYYIPDSREEYGNAIDFLHDLLLPYFDKKIEDKAKDFYTKIEEARKDCLKKTSVKEKEVLSDDYYKKESDKISVEEYKLKKLRIKRELLQEISLLLKRKKYLEGKDIGEAF